MDTPNHIETLVDKLVPVINEKMSAFKEEFEKDAAERDSQKLDALEKQLQDLGAQVNKALEIENNRWNLPGTELTGDPTKDFSIARAARAVASRDWSKAGLEKEVFAEMAKKDMSAGVDSSGGFLVPNQIVRPIIDIFRARVVAFKLGAREMAVTGSPVQIPRQSSKSTAYWVGEHESITKSEITLDQLTGTPHTLAARSILSNQLLEMSVPGADQLIREDFAQQMARGMDLAILSGTGASGQPLGITNTTGVGTSSLTAALPVYSELLAFPAALRDADAFQGKMGWASSANQLSLLEKVVDETGLSMLRRFFTDFAGGQMGGAAGGANGPNNANSGGATNLLGFPLESTTQMPDASAAGALIFGNWEDVMVLNWGGLRMAASQETDEAFARDQTHIRALMRRDVIVRNPESFVVSTV